MTLENIAVLFIHPPVGACSERLRFLLIGALISAIAFWSVSLATVLPLMNRNYNVIMLLAPFFMLVALWLMWGVRRGEAKEMEAVYAR